MPGQKAKLGVKTQQHEAARARACLRLKSAGMESQDKELDLSGELSREEGGLGEVGRRVVHRLGGPKFLIFPTV